MKRFLLEKWRYILGGLLILLIILGEARVRGDFNIFMLASSDLLEGKNIYLETYYTWYHYYYSVFFALILSPFTFLSLYFVKVVWLLANVFFSVQIWKILRSHLPFDRISKKAQTVFTILAFLFVVKFLRDNFHVAQVTILILYLTLQGLQLIWKDRPLIGALLLAVGIDIKLLPLVFLPYLLYRGEWKAFFYCITFLCVLLFIPGLFIGFEYNQFLIAERWKLINPTNQEHVLDTLERSFHSLTTVLSVFLVEDSGDKFAMPIKRNIADISITQLALIITIVRLFFVLLTLYFLRSLPFKKNNDPLQQLYEVSYICLVIPLIFPHQQHYAFLFIFPATTYVLFFIMNTFFIQENTVRSIARWKWLVSFSLFLVFFSVNSHFLVGAFSEYYDHFKTMTFGVLLLLVLLACFPPKKFSAPLR
jgi:hypothetical protein